MFQHLRGYFKNDATPTEKESYLSLLTELETKAVTYNMCIHFIQNLIQKYQQLYLLQSAIMDLSKETQRTFHLKIHCAFLLVSFMTISVRSLSHQDD